MKRLQILGADCARCSKLHEITEAVARELGLDYRLEKVTDVDRIAALGVFLTPALAVDGVVKVGGRVPSPAELRALLA